MRRPPTSLAMAALLVATGACSSSKDDPPTTADDVDDVTAGSEAAAAETDAQLITSSLVASSSSELATSAGDLGTRAFGDGARAIYFPPRCLTVTNDAEAKTATYTFDHCTGPNGLRDVTGEVRASYAVDVAAARLSLDLTAVGVQVNKATVDWKARADITSSPDGTRSMTWNATLSGTSGGGRRLDRTLATTTSWRLGEPCFGLDGTSEGGIDGHAIRTEIQGFRRCRRACPDAGGKIIVTNVTKSTTFELRYDGTNRATFVDPRGNEVVVPLLCAQ